MTIASNLGFPRIGDHRHLKHVTEKYWAGQASAQDLLEAGKTIRAANWQLQKDAGLTHIPSNDFSFYDHILDTAVTFGAIPERYHFSNPANQSIDPYKTATFPNTIKVPDSASADLDLYFHLARGCANNACSLHPGTTVSAMEMTKWFDTNYHYIVPELASDQEFVLNASKPLEHFLEAKELGIHTRPVIIGPVSFLLLSKMPDPKTDRFTLLERLLPAYLELFAQLKKAGADWVQIDEPCLVLDLDAKAKQAYKQAYAFFAKSSLKLLLTTYFCRLGENLELALNLPTAGIHLDFTAGETLQSVSAHWPKNKVLSAGVIEM